MAQTSAQQIKQNPWNLKIMCRTVSSKEMKVLQIPPAVVKVIFTPTHSFNTYLLRPHPVLATGPTEIPTWRRLRGTWLSDPELLETGSKHIQSKITNYIQKKITPTSFIETFFEERNVIGSTRSGQEGKSNHWTLAGRQRAGPNSWGGIFPTLVPIPGTALRPQGTGANLRDLKPGDVGGLITELTGQDKFCLFSEDPLSHRMAVWNDLEPRLFSQMAMCVLKDDQGCRLPLRVLI